MIAFVLSGGGNRAALQVGAVGALLEHGIRPDLFVGSSAGGLNAAFLAACPTPDGVAALVRTWLEASGERIYADGRARLAWRLATQRQSLYSPDRLEAFVRAHLPAGVLTFADLAVPLRIVTTDLISAETYVMGDRGDESVVEAVMASAAIPPFFPPRAHAGRLLVDGAVTADLPVEVAVARGATVVYALDMAPEPAPVNPRWSAAETAWRSVTTMMLGQRDHDLARCAALPGLVLHHLRLHTECHPSYRDFRHTAEMIEEGRRAAEVYLRRAAAEGLDDSEVTSGSAPGQRESRISTAPATEPPLPSVAAPALAWAPDAPRPRRGR